MKPTFRAQMAFWDEKHGGFSQSVALSFPLRFKVRFPALGNLHFGAILMSGDALPCLGETGVFEIALFDPVTSAPYLQVGQRFRFGDLSDRGEGEITDLLG